MRKTIWFAAILAGADQEVPSKVSALVVVTARQLLGDGQENPWTSVSAGSAGPGVHVPLE